MVFLRFLLLVTALYSVPYGLVFLLAPSWGLTLFGMHTNEVGLLIARYFGAFALGVGLFSWVVRMETPNMFPRVSTYVCLFTAFGATLCVSLYALVTGLLPAGIAWLVVFFDLFFTAGYGYFLFVGDPKTS